ncbi:hypothetical protein EYF80_040220 [Liparis tanakae]|uniref:Uncharacterized protein n=1 Tax=Liparis tanakae TaxID=230148 RepID=A0A4Z2GAK9_9TELE|nr:hypothetical protein EYF80_040220 [Liparis tanakae]
MFKKIKSDYFDVEDQLVAPDAELGFKQNCELLLRHRLGTAAQRFGLLLAHDDRLDLRWIHVDVELPAHQEAHRGRKLGLGLQHLGRLLFNDEGAEGKGGGGGRDNDRMGWSTGSLHHGSSVPPASPTTSPRPLHYTEAAMSSSHLVTRAEMMSVMSAFSLLSSSSMGPGRGSCWVRCSQRRICCRFCQMRSASFSHLVDGGHTATV